MHTDAVLSGLDACWMSAWMEDDRAWSELIQGRCFGLDVQE